jgi:abhydrolase domain-containing protein 14
VLLLHGMKFNAATWQELGTLEKLAGAGFHPVAVDMPGFGESPVCDKDQDEILSAFISQGELNRPVMIGPSMGGRIALEFAVNHPGILGGLVLVGAVGVEENRERLAEIDIPVLIIWGGEDRISPLANSDILLESIKGAERLVIDGAPHPCYLDQPDRWHGAVLDFLNGL